MSKSVFQQSLASVQSLSRRTRMGVLSLVVLLTLVLTVALHPAVAQTPGNQIDGYPVLLDDTELFRIKQGIAGVVSAEERAEVINERLIQVANNSGVSPETIRVEEQDNSSVVLAGETVLFTVRESDPEIGQSRQVLAEKSVQIMRSAVTQYRRDRSFQQIMQGVLFAGLSTLGLIGFLVLLQRLISRLLIQIRAAQQADRLDLRVQSFQVLGSNATGYLLGGFVNLLRLILILTSLYLYIPFVLSQFPATRAIGKSIFDDTIYRINQLITTFVQYLPNLVTMLIIALVTHYIIQFAKLVIAELGRDDAYPWFYPEWVSPTTRLVKLLLIAIACIVAAPYLPGFNSPAFQGISLFLGALFTLGSSSVVANAIAGTILIYTRAFRIGDIIRIGDVTGEVIEKSLFVTRILTFKKETITIPNSSVLNSNVINFNAVSRIAQQYLVLHTTVTLGYDLSWRKVHDVLIAAATATPGIVSTPGPFVLQTALNDYNVSYELNAYSNQPQFMPKIYSDLHQNIQDYCNQAGIEILSPAYSALRDGNHSTIPGDYLPDDYRSTGFQIHSQNSHHQP
jgi:small-conductance mechanosensitive channel